MGGCAFRGSRSTPIRLPFTPVLGDVIRLYGVPVPEDDARNLVTTLLADGSEDALEAARISRALEVDAALVALSVEQRDASLASLEDASTDGLAELRGALARDLLERKTCP